jgi:predicted xylose isomerase-like sugar epimerase
LRAAPQASPSGDRFGVTGHLHLSGFTGQAAVADLADDHRVTVIDEEETS